MWTVGQADSGLSEASIWGKGRLSKAASEPMVGADVRSVYQSCVTLSVVAASVGFAGSAEAQPHPETIIQYFETSWVEVTARMPEIAAAGYTSIWLPPPTKGAEGVVDVGFSVFDRFDLGSVDQRGTIATRYGTHAELIAMVEEAHRFGLKVYFDTVMNHNANPSLIENQGVTLEPVPIDGFPGTRPLDYHVLPARDVGNGNWEVRWPALLGGGTRVLSPNFGANEQFVATVPMPMGTTVPGYTHLARAPWFTFNGPTIEEEQYLSLLGLIDFSIEQLVQGNGPAPNDGTNLVAELPLPVYIRHPNNPEFYPNQTPVPEDIREYMMRWIKWFGDTTDCDGLRLDAIKHAPTQFFNVDYPGDPIAFNQAFQDNLDERRQTMDANDDDGIDDALLFGESFTGDIGGLLAYRATGMYLLDFPLLFKLGEGGGVFSQGGSGDIGQLTFPQGGLDGFDAEFGGLGRTAGVTFVQSHDTEAPHTQPNAAYAYTLTRVGHSVVFYDGNNYTDRSFVKPGRVDALGELSSNTILDLLSIRRRFARGGMFNRYVDGDVYIYERVQRTQNGSGGATLLVAITDNTQNEARFGEFDPRPLVVTEFPPGTELVELTGHGQVSELTVIDPAAVPAMARDNAIAEYDRSSDYPLPSTYGLVYLQIPAGPDIGYVAYAPKTAAANVSLTVGGNTLAPYPVMTAGPRRTPNGAPVSAQTIDTGTLPRGASLTVTLASDELADAAYVEIDNGTIVVPNQTAASGTPDGLYDGFYPMNDQGNDAYELTLDLSMLQPGVHVVRVRVANAGTPSFYTDSVAYISVVDGAPIPDGGVTPDAGTVDTDGGVPDGGTTGPRDGGVSSNDPDPDRDGIPNGTDICPTIADPDQADFDGDGAGDACDLCPQTSQGTTVDADGCPMVDPALRATLDQVVELILSEKFDAAYDANLDGVIDGRDFVVLANGGTQ